LSRYLMVRVLAESWWFFLSLLAKEFAWSEVTRGFESLGEIVGCEEIGQVLPQMVVCLTVEALDRRFFDRAVHSLNLAVCPGLAGLY
jgi:hypothetical protein